MPKHDSGGRKRLSKAPRRHRTASAIFISMGRTFRRTKKKVSSGYKKLPSRETQTDKIHLGKCIVMDAVWSEAMCVPICGSLSPFSNTDKVKRVWRRQHNVET